MRERGPSSFVPCHLQESWHCLSPAVAHGRIGLAPRLSSALELTLAAWWRAGQVSQSCGQESSRAEPASSLYATPWLFPSTPCQLWQAGEPVARVVRMDELALSPTNCSNWKSVLHTSPGPRWYVWKSLTQEGTESRRTVPASWCLVCWVSQLGSAVESYPVGD